MVGKERPAVLYSGCAKILADENVVETQDGNRHRPRLGKTAAGFIEAVGHQLFHFVEMDRFARCVEVTHHDHLLCWVRL